MEAQHTFLRKAWEQKSKYVSVIASVVVSFIFVFISVYGATTVGTNLSTTGTLSVTGLTTMAGFISTASSTAGAAFSVTGALAASSTLQATGNAILYGTTTLNIASSSPAQELSVDGDGYFHAQNGTTSVIVGSTGTGVGSCLQLRGTDGNWYHIYATSSASYVFFQTGPCLAQ